MDAPELALVWDDDVAFERRRNPAARPFLFIENRGNGVWEDEGGEYWAFVHVFKAESGERLPTREVAIAGVGRSYRLLPGERAEIPAVFGSDLSQHPPGRYQFEASIAELNLHSERKAVEL